MRGLMSLKNSFSSLNSALAVVSERVCLTKAAMESHDKRLDDSWVERRRTGTETSNLARMWTNFGLLRRHWQLGCELGEVSLLLIREVESSFEWREVSSYTLMWAFIGCQILALTSCLGYGNAACGVCFPFYLLHLLHICIYLLSFIGITCLPIKFQYKNERSSNLY